MTVWVSRKKDQGMVSIGSVRFLFEFLFIKLLDVSLFEEDALFTYPFNVLIRVFLLSFFHLRNLHFFFLSSGICFLALAGKCA